MKNDGSHGGFSAEYESFDLDDTRYYGVFIKEKDKSVGIDPKRWEECFSPNEVLPEKVKRKMMEKDGKLFHPAKKLRSDYTVNRMLDNLIDIQHQWKKYKKIINHFLNGISGKEFTIDEDSSLLSADYAEAMDRAEERTSVSSMLAQCEKDEQYISLHEAFFHQMASQVEALFLKAITENGYEEKKSFREGLYNFKTNEKYLKNLNGFHEFDKMYSIWIFLKHNSVSAFNCVKTKYSDVLKESNYLQGGLLARNFIKFDTSLFESILNGIKIFIAEYCLLVFKEDADEASWNYEEFFLNHAYDMIREEQDPCGISSLFGE